MKPSGIQDGGTWRPDEGDATPLGLIGVRITCPRVARTSQPWAGGRNPVGIAGGPRRVGSGRVLCGGIPVERLCGGRMSLAHGTVAGSA